MSPDSSPVDLLAIMPHPDDAELLCGGTLIRAADQGYRTGVLDLTGGERGTRGSRERRRQESECATRAMGLAVRRNLGLPDAGVENSAEARVQLVEAIRELRPCTVILPYLEGRHPDHRITAELGYDACYLAGLANLDAGGERHRPTKILYALAYREDPVKPTFVVDISEAFERKMQAIRCYGSQFDGIDAIGELFPTGVTLYELVQIQSARYGSLIRAAYGEPFYTRETVRVEDVVELPVRSL